MIVGYQKGVQERMVFLIRILVLFGLVYFGLKIVRKLIFGAENPRISRGNKSQQQGEIIDLDPETGEPLKKGPFNRN